MRFLRHSIMQGTVECHLLPLATIRLLHSVFLRKYVNGPAIFTDRIGAGKATGDRVRRVPIHRHENGD